MKLKWAQYAIALLVIGSAYGFIVSDKELKRVVSPAIVFLKTHLLHSLLSETPDTHDIVRLLRVYRAYDAEGPIQLRRIGRDRDGGYVVPEIAIQKADAVMGYGISDDISFEESVAAIYEKPSWGFDGTCPPVETTHELCHFVPLCIVSNKQMSEGRNASFDEQVEMLGIRGKKLFVKMDIEGNEYDTLPDLLQHTRDITGIVLEIHFPADNQIAEALNLLRTLDKDFLLVHVHGNNYCLDHFVTSNSTGRLPRVMELSYINKRLVEKYEISPDQSHPTKDDLPNNRDVSDMEFAILDL